MRQNEKNCHKNRPCKRAFRAASTLPCVYTANNFTHGRGSQKANLNEYKRILSRRHFYKFGVDKE